MEAEFNELSKEHSKRKKDFSCSNEDLNNYLKKQAGQDVKNNLCRCFVLVNKEDNNNNGDIIGFFTISLESEYRDNLEGKFKRSIPYERVGMILIGRMAVATKYEGNRIGEDLILEALNIAVDVYKKVPFKAVVIDPKDNNLVKYYEKLGFTKLDTKMRVMMSIEKIMDTLAIAA